MKTPNYKLQAIIENTKPWPFVGNAYTNTNGSITILLDRGVKLELPDGTKLDGTVKLYLREFRGRNDAAAAPTEA
jgi:hypothetical protein